MSLFKKALILSSCAGLFLAVAPQRAQADMTNQRTVAMVYQPVEIPGKVLLPGTYVMKLLDPNFGRDAVAIYNASETHLIDTVLATPDYRLHPESKTVFLFDETSSENPLALGSWFYPGKNFGLQFLYPHAQAERMFTASIREVSGAPTGGK